MSKSLLNQKTDEEFIKIVNESQSIAECERKLGYNAYSGHVATKIKERIELLGLDISHFSNTLKQVRTPEDIFVQNSTACQKIMRKYYLRGNYSTYECSICGQPPEWQGKPLTLILDHTNGINNDHRLNNLRWVCPNCNQQLDTTGSKNQAYKNSN